MARDKTSIMKNAQKFAAKGQIDKALAEWQKILDDNPSDGNTHNTVGDLHLKKNDKAAAVSSFFKAADLFKTAGFSLKAMALYKKILNIDASQIDALLSLASLNAERGLASNANENYIGAADIHLKNGNTEAALEIYEKMVELSPTNAMIRGKVADLYIKMGRREKACKEYLACADVLIEEGKLEKAETALRRVKEMMPSHPQAYLGLSRVLRAAGKEKEAKEEIRQAQGVVAGDPQMGYLYAKSAADAGLVDEALAALETILSGEPHHGAANRLKGEILLRAGRGGEAWEALFPIAEDLAVEGNMGDAIAILEPFTGDQEHRKDALLRLATLYRNAGDGGKAGKTFKALGTAYEEAGQVREAQRAFTEASSLLPEDEILKEKVAGFAVEEQAPVQAATTKEVPAEFGVGGMVDLELGDSAGEPEKSVGEILLEIEVFVRYGQFDRALESLENIKDKDPDNPDIQIWFQKVHAERGEHDAMFSACARAVRLLVDTGETERARDIVQEAAAVCPEDARLNGLRSAVGGETTVAGGFGGGEIELEGSEAGFGEVGTGQTGGWGGHEATGDDGVGFGEMSFPGEMSFGEQEEKPEEPPGEQQAWGEGWPGGDVDDSWVGGGVETAGIDETFESLSATEAREAESERSAGPESEDLALDREIEASSATWGDGVDLHGGEDAGEGSFVEEAIPGESAGDEPVFEEPVSERIVAGEKTGPAVSAAGDVPARDLADYDDDLAEAEFYAQQGLTDEAEKIFERLTDLFPGNEELEGKIRALGLPLPGGHAGDEPGIGEATQDVSAETELGDEESWGFETGFEEGAEEVAETLATDEEDWSFEEEVETEAAQGVEEPLAAVEEEPAEVFETVAVNGEPDAEFETLDLFEDEEDEQEDVAPAEVDTDQELAEIFNAFKQGVEKELEEGDFETHYNLGIAYKEMGLLDDAIREFQIVNKSPELSLDGASMLGMCYLEKGLPELAVEQYRRALEMVSAGGPGADNVLAVKFDLADALEQAGNTDESRGLFIEVYSEDAKFRDVSTRVEALKKQAGAPETPAQPTRKRDRVSYI